MCSPLCRRWFPGDRSAHGGLLFLLVYLLSGCADLPERILATPEEAPGHAPAAVILRETPRPACINLTPAIEYWVDTEDSQRIDTLLRPGASLPFARVDAASVNMGFVGTPVWLRFRLRNLTGRDQRYIIEFSNPRLARVEFYEQGTLGRILVSASGAAVSARERPVFHADPSFQIALPNGAEQTYYINIRNSGSLRFAAHLWPEQAFAEHGIRSRAAIFVLVGALLAMTIYHFIIYLMLRERAYLFLALMTLLFAIYQFARTGLGAMLLWPNAPYWSTHSVVTMIMLTTAAATFFVDSFLEADKRNPTLSRFLRLLGWANIISGLFGLTDLLFKYYLSHIVGLVTAATVLAVVLMQMRSGARAARIFLLGWGFTLLSAVVFALLGPGFLPSNYITENFVEISLLSAAVLCSMALADRLKVREVEQRLALENAVQMRTAELAKALEEVRTLSGLLPICSHCKKIRDDKGYWNSLEKYLYEHTDAVLSHGICPDCAQQHYPEIFNRQHSKGDERPKAP